MRFTDRFKRSPKDDSGINKSFKDAQSRLSQAGINSTNDSNSADASAASVDDRLQEMKTQMASSTQSQTVVSPTVQPISNDNQHPINNIISDTPSTTDTDINLGTQTEVSMNSNTDSDSAVASHDSTGTDTASNSAVSTSFNEGSSLPITDTEASPNTLGDENPSSVNSVSSEGEELESMVSNDSNDNYTENDTSENAQNAATDEVLSTPENLVTNSAGPDLQAEQSDYPENWGGTQDTSAPPSDMSYDGFPTTSNYDSAGPDLQAEQSDYPENWGGTQDTSAPPSDMSYDGFPTTDEASGPDLQAEQSDYPENWH